MAACCCGDDAWGNPRGKECWSFLHTSATTTRAFWQGESGSSSGVARVIVVAVEVETEEKRGAVLGLESELAWNWPAAVQRRFFKAVLSVSSSVGAIQCMTLAGIVVREGI